MQLQINISLPVLWGNAVFAKHDWGAVNFVVGPNGTGKSLFAEQMRIQLTANGVRARYVSADRLSGLEKSANPLTHNPLTRGFDTAQFGNYRSWGESFGFAPDAFAILKEKMDVRLRIEATLFQLFGRRMRLAEESGFLRPRLQRIEGGEEYGMQESEAHGLKELIVLLTYLYDDSFGALILDEPELHLHPQFQSLFVQEVRRIAGDPRQDPTKKAFFLITHSPYIIDFRTLEELQNCIVFRPGRVPRAVDSGSDEDQWKLRKLLPRLNTHHKQFFFANRPIFVEGYTDQQIATLIQERRGKVLGAVGASVIDVGGKEELDLFFRICRGIGLDAQIITDLDALFEGRLRQSVTTDPRCVTCVSREGLGTEPSRLIGELETWCGSLADACEAALAAKASRNAEEAHLLASLQAANSNPDAQRKLRLRRYTILIAISRYRAGIQALLPTALSEIELVAARRDKLLDAFREAGVHVLGSGELENYLPSYRGNPYSVSDAAKVLTFEQERDILLSQNLSAIEIAQRYGELAEVLDQAAAGPKLGIEDELNLALSGWIHEVQLGVRRGMIRDIVSLTRYASADWSAFSRLLEPVTFDVTDTGFRCRMRIKRSIDEAQREFQFTQDLVASRFVLLPASSGGT